LERMRENGVEILKDLGVASLRSIPITEWENDRGVGLEAKGTETEIHPEYRKVFEKIAFVKDPVSCLLPSIQTPQLFLCQAASLVFFCSVPLSFWRDLCV